MTMHIVHLDADAGLARTHCGRQNRDVYECSRCGAHDEADAGPWVQCGGMLHREKRLGSCRATRSEPVECGAGQRIRDASGANERAAEHRKLARGVYTERERSRRTWPDDWGKMHPSEPGARNVYARSGT